MHKSICFICRWQPITSFRMIVFLKSDATKVSAAQCEVLSLIWKYQLHAGITTDIIAKRCGYNVIGVDKVGNNVSINILDAHIDMHPYWTFATCYVQSALVIDDASKRFPKVRFK